VEKGNVTQHVKGETDVTEKGIVQICPDLNKTMASARLGYYSEHTSTDLLTDTDQTVQECACDADVHSRQRSMSRPRIESKEQIATPSSTVN